MNKDISKVIETIGHEIIHLAEKILDEKGLENSNLKRDISSQIDMNNIVIYTYFNNYIEYIESGRSPRQGSPPPIDAIIDWCKRKNISTDNNIVYAIRQAIWRDGFQARPILSVLEKEVSLQFDNKWSEQIFESITNELTKYFN